MPASAMPWRCVSRRLERRLSGWPAATQSDLAPPKAPSPNRNAGRGTASDPGNVSLSREKLEVLYPNFFTSSGLLMRVWKSLAGSAPFSPSAIDKHLQFGDSRAAVVVSVSRRASIANSSTT